LFETTNCWYFIFHASGQADGKGASTIHHCQLKSDCKDTTFFWIIKRLLLKKRFTLIQIDVYQQFICNIFSIQMLFAGCSAGAFLFEKLGFGVFLSLWGMKVWEIALNGLNFYSLA